VVVFVNFLRRNLTADDAAEEAVGIGHIQFTPTGLPSGNDNTVPRSCQPLAENGRANAIEFTGTWWPDR
jgi:hypothetical protein